MEFVRFDGIESDFNARKGLESLLLGEKRVTDFEFSEQEEVLSVAIHALIEQGVEFDPQKRQYLRILIYALAGIVAQGLPNPSIGLPTEYKLSIDGVDVDLKSITFFDSGFSNEALYDLGDRVDNLSTRSIQCIFHSVSSFDGSVMLNLQLHRICNLSSGQEVRCLRIVDRYVCPDLRGMGVGDRLLKTIDDIARITGVKFVFGQLVPEDPSNMNLLQSGHVENGYDIEEKQGGRIIAIKEFSLE
jgi:GNAT superfamily N-acetyltransferase